MNRFIFFWLFCFFIIGCPQDPEQKDAAGWIVKVGAEPISDVALLLHWSQRHIFEIKDTAAQLRLAEKTAYQLGIDLALIRRAEGEGLGVSEEEIQREIRQLSQGFSRSKFKSILQAENWTSQNFEEQIRRRLLIKKFFQKEKKVLKPITEAEIREYYEKEFLPKVPKEEVRARHLLVDTHEEANYVREKLFGKNAMPFEAAARRFSKAPEAVRGGELDWFGKGDLPQVFDVCFKLKVNSVSQVIESEYGFHLIKVLERRKGKAESYEVKKEHIEKLLRQLKEEKLIQDVRKALADEVKIHIHAQNLKSRFLRFQKEIGAQKTHDQKHQSQPHTHPPH